MDLQQATLAMALLMKKEKDFYKQFLDGYENRKDENYQQLIHQFEYIKANTREFGNRLAANPHFFNILESWSVTITGKEGVSDETMKESAQKNDADTLINKAGNLALEAKKFIKSQNLPIFKMSAGEDGWDISVLCTEKISRELCLNLHQRFFHAIQLKLLNLSRRFAGHNLPGLYNWNDAERILKAYGNDIQF